MRALVLLMLLPVIAALSAGCETARMSERIDGMRVLAIRAEPPTARPGEKIRLEALVATRSENDPEVALTWFFCTADFDACAEADVPGGEGIVVLGQGPGAIARIPEQTLTGETVLVWLDARKGSEHERSIKGIFVRPESEPPNANPVLDRVRWGGDAPREEASYGERVSVHLGASSMINEIHLESGEPAAEDVRISTYTTEGALVDPSGSGASGSLYFEAPAEKGRVGTWVVVNDGRGGVGWVQHWISVSKSGGTAE